MSDEQRPPGFYLVLHKDPNIAGHRWEPAELRNDTLRMMSGVVISPDDPYVQWGRRIPAQDDQRPAGFYWARWPATAGDDAGRWTTVLVTGASGERATLNLAGNYEDMGFYAVWGPRIPSPDEEGGRPVAETLSGIPVIPDSSMPRGTFAIQQQANKRASVLHKSGILAEVWRP